MAFERIDGERMDGGRITVRGAVRMGIRGAMAAALIVSLAACQSNRTTARTAPPEDVRENSILRDLAGVLQTAPDEFSVITKRPLEMPQDFAALPVPEPGRRSSRDLDPLTEARAALAFDPAPAAARAAPVAPSATEAAILSATGPVDPDIRATLAGEQALYEQGQNAYLLDRIFPSLRRIRGDEFPEAIDPEAERQRLFETGVARGAASATAVPQPTAAPLPPSTVAVAPPPVAAPTVSAPTLSVPIDPVSDGGLIYLPQ